MNKGKLSLTNYKQKHILDFIQKKISEETLRQSLRHVQASDARTLVKGDLGKHMSAQKKRIK